VTIPAGRFSERVQLLSPDAATDDGYTTTPGGWSDAGSRWAQYMPGTVREVFENAGNEGKLPAVFMVRRDSLTDQVDETWKLVHRFTSYDIAGAVMTADRAFVRITCTGGDKVAT
jgi:head-tail adaptor